MRKSFVKNTKVLLSSIALLFVLFVCGQQSVFAGNQPTATVESTGSIKTLRQTRPDEKQLAAAQMRNEIRPTSGGTNSVGGDSATRLQFSFFFSVTVLIAAIWTLFVLLRNRFGKKLTRNGGRFEKLKGLMTQPSFALSVFGFSFAAVLVGGQLTSPTTVSAERQKKEVRSQSFVPASKASKAVFKSAQQIGDGDGITQIGTPFFDQQGNRYIRGGFSRSLNVGATTLNATRDFDLFFAKYDANGNALWARQGSGANNAIPDRLANEGATVLTVDQNGNIYVGGSFVKSVTLQGGTNAHQTLTDAGGAGINYESFIAKYDANGNLLWAKGGNSNSPQNANNLEVGQNAIDQIIVGSDGDLYVTGLASGNRFFGETFAGGGQSDIILAKISSANGAIVWKQIIGGTDDDGGLDLEIDGAGNLYLFGNFTSPTITFPNGTTFNNSKTEKDDRSVNSFIAKFDDDGTNLWVKNLDNDETLGGTQVTVNQAGEIFLTGYFYGIATFDTIVLTESTGDGEDEEANFAGYLAKMNSNGNFIWAKSFGGLGEAIALDATGRVYVAGTFWDSGVFGAGEPNEESLASFGGEDIFIARFETNGNLEWAKPIAASGINGQIIIGDPTDPDNKTDNNYNPLGIAYNAARGTIFMSGDFENAVALDCQTLVVNGIGTHAYIAELSADNEQTSCRIWNGLDDDDNDFDSPDNWNGGVLPVAGDSVFAPFTGNDYDPPSFNPATNITLSNVSLADNRILTLEKPLTITNRLDLLGGFVDAENFPLLLGENAQSFATAEGLVLGRMQKQFANGFAGSFTFPVGTAGKKYFPEYSPVTLSNISGAGSFSVNAHRGIYPNAAANLPMNRANRWWNLSNNGLAQASLTFQYVDGDISQGAETKYRAYRIGNGSATRINSSIDVAKNIVSVPNVSQFSDWTLAESLTPLASTASIGGRVLTANGFGVSQVRVTMTDEQGNQRQAITNSFGYYRFDNVATGLTFTFNVRNKRWSINPATQVQNIQEDRDDLNFIAPQ